MHNAENHFLNKRVDPYTTYVGSLNGNTHHRSELSFHLSPSFGLFLVLDPCEGVGNVVNGRALQAESSALVGTES